MKAINHPCELLHSLIVARSSKLQKEYSSHGKEQAMPSGQSPLKEVKYAQYLVYAASILYLVLSLLQEINAAIAQMKADKGFFIDLTPFFVCALGFFIGRSLGHLHSEARKFVILLAGLDLFFSVVGAVQQGLSRSLPISGNIFLLIGYMSGVLYAVISVFLLYYLTRSHVREAFRKARRDPSPEEDSAQ